MDTLLNALFVLAAIVTIVAMPSIVKGFLEIVDDFYEVRHTLAKVVWAIMVIASLIYIGVYYFVK